MRGLPVALVICSEETDQVFLLVKDPVGKEFPEYCGIPYETYWITQKQLCPQSPPEKSKISWMAGERVKGGTQRRGKRRWIMARPLLPVRRDRYGLRPQASRRARPRTHFVMALHARSIQEAQAF